VASDGLGTFPIAGEVRAGGSGVTITAGQVAYITTGAPVPEGADAVIQVEDTERVPGSAEVTIRKAATAGQDIRTVGSDIDKVWASTPDGQSAFAGGCHSMCLCVKPRHSMSGAGCDSACCERQCSG
jgi:molybdopterin biosynthesis enzyme